MRGLLLFAHGARDPRWSAPFEAVALRVQQLRPGAQVRLAYLEFMAPRLEQALDDLVRSGCRRIDVVPLFLGAGGHVRQDVPALLKQASRRHPDVALELHAAAGESAGVIDALAQTAAGALPTAAADTPAAPQPAPTDPA